MEHKKTKKLIRFLFFSFLFLIFFGNLQLSKTSSMLPYGDFFQHLKLSCYLNRFKINNPMISRAHVLSFSLFGYNWEVYGKAVESVAKEAAENS